MSRCPGRKDNYSQSGFRAGATGLAKWCKVGNYANFAPGVGWGCGVYQPPLDLSVSS